MTRNKNSFLGKMIKVAWVVWGICFLTSLIFLAVTASWAEMLPDNKLYKLKVVRNKIVERMIISPVKKVEYDLLMADKMIVTSKLLVDKGKITLAKHTALKGENYYSILAQDYKRAIQEKKNIPKDLDARITIAAKKHQEIFKKLENLARGEDKKTFQATYNFSKINYAFIEGLRKIK